MNEEMMTNEVTEVEANEIEVIDMPEESGDNGLVGKIAIGVGVVLVGGAIALLKSRHKLKAWNEARAANKLRKKGYTVSRIVYRDSERNAAEYVDEDVQEETTAE